MQGITLSRPVQMARLLRVTSRGRLRGSLMLLRHSKMGLTFRWECCRGPANTVNEDEVSVRIRCCSGVYGQIARLHGVTDQTAAITGLSLQL